MKEVRDEVEIRDFSVFQLGELVRVAAPISWLLGQPNGWDKAMFGTLELPSPEDDYFLWEYHFPFHS